jgi:hypothetical protein
MSQKRWTNDPDVLGEIVTQMDFQDTLQATIVLLSIGDYLFIESKFTVKVLR